MIVFFLQIFFITFTANKPISKIYILYRCKHTDKKNMRKWYDALFFFLFVTNIRYFFTFSKFSYLFQNITRNTHRLRCKRKLLLGLKPFSYRFRMRNQDISLNALCLPRIPSIVGIYGREKCYKSLIFYSLSERANEISISLHPKCIFFITFLQVSFTSTCAIP